MGEIADYVHLGGWLFRWMAYEFMAGMGGFYLGGIDRTYVHLGGWLFRRVADYLMNLWLGGWILLG